MILFAHLSATQSTVRLIAIIQKGKMTIFPAHQCRLQIQATVNVDFQF